ncbi:hypothetical protein [Cerasicoccus fimbriatus]|uniref:hypothetical protein n=1 Tax=Cerasicoccus fimbriatus TaxID=3014554 RepID=UPI0022B50E75|nr:hypothetical protein [Cerasicoccus sp. TK19100]
MISETVLSPKMGVQDNGVAITNAAPATVMIDGERFSCIDNAEAMPPFFMTMVSATDHWLFASSEGPLTAGRESPDRALFPYYTVDKIMDNWNTTGPRTVILCEDQRWEPFMPYMAQFFQIERRLLKSINSDSIIFEETNNDLGLRFSYRLRTSEKYGFIRSAKLENLTAEDRVLMVMDGIENFLPAGLDVRTQNAYSCLCDAYKLTEIHAENGLLIHRMASGLTDEAAPMESLLATTVWSYGWPDSKVVAHRKSAEKILKGEANSEGPQVRATRGAYFNVGQVRLPASGKFKWSQVAEIDQTQSAVADIVQQLKQPQKLWKAVRDDIDRGSQRLEQLIASADGQQVTSDASYCSHHRSNVLFNIMRGGVFADNYQLNKHQLIKSMRTFKKTLSQEEVEWLDALPDSIAYPELVKRARAEASDDLLRLCQEHLPLIFSRRHGDPSRPWNVFTLRMKDERGDDVVGYEGNWRDIFQNWEALAFSFPQYNEAFLRKFLNASTADGYNPYRITADGVDWEKPDPEDPWATIGYWGDHQIVYLLKLLEFAEQFNGGALVSMLSEGGYVFTDIPYALKPFADLARDPNHSIEFDVEKDRMITERVAHAGADGKLLHDANGAIRHAGFLEKLLIPALVKISNFCPGGGIWMNTQRPEWNDANNALAGWGLSVVTTAYLYRYLSFLKRVVGQGDASYACSDALLGLMAAQTETLQSNSADVIDDDKSRYRMLFQLGRSGEHYRKQVYCNDFGSQSNVSTEQVITWIDAALAHISTTLQASQRSDGLFHSYNTLRIDTDLETASVAHLGEMLEGQVAMLSAGLLSTDETLVVLRQLRNSRLYCAHRNSYILYADKELPSFLEMNCVPADAVEEMPLLAKLVERDDRSIIEYSASEGCYRFHSNLANRFELDKALDRLASQSELADMVAKDRRSVQDLYEATFNHQAFTGRSGSMFAYEGLGSIYWHMVSKLMLAVGEKAVAAGRAGDTNFEALKDHYFEIQNGLGFRKTPHEYGAFSADAYSHTPAHAGAQQPGLTGMVKEGILARFAELGVEYREQGISFQPRVMRDSEFLAKETGCRVLGADGITRGLNVPAGGMMFTLAQTPIIYAQSDRATARIEVCYVDGSVTVVNGYQLPRGIASDIIDRTGSIDHLVVRLPA